MGILTLSLCPTFIQKGGFLWQCEENNGWLAFRNLVSGGYIGYKNKRYVCEAQNLNATVNLCARRHPDGGYILMSLIGDKWWDLSISQNSFVTSKSGEGTRWLFSVWTEPSAFDSLL